MNLPQNGHIISAVKARSYGSGPSVANLSASIRDRTQRCLKIKTFWSPSERADLSCIETASRRLVSTTADPGSTLRAGCLWVPALRCIVKNAAPRPGHVVASLAITASCKAWLFENQNGRHPEERPLGRVSKDGHRERSPSFEARRRRLAPQDDDDRFAQIATEQQDRDKLPRCG
jgi:hypothetical protein